MLERADDAPLVTSFRALGAAPAMRGVPRVSQLLDSLNDLDKARSDFGSSDGADPIFVALTARVGVDRSRDRGGGAIASRGNAAHDRFAHAATCRWAR